MKRNIIVIAYILLIVAVLSLGIGGCSKTETSSTVATTTPTPTTSTPVATTPTTPSAPTLSSIAVTPASPVNITVGSNQRFTATGTYTDGSSRELFSATWTSDNPSVVNIDSTGLARGMAEGQANITASQAGITSAPVSINVAPAPPPETTTPPETTAPTTTPSEGVIVYVSVSVDNVLLVAAQPVTITELTAEAAVKAAHEAYYSGGLDGFTAGTEAFGYVISKCWGVQNYPYIIVNDNSPVAGSPTVDKYPVAANDNIIICTGANTQTISPVSLKATISGDSATLTATAWTLSMTTFTYSSAPLKNANVVDPITGASLGTTDDNGQITITIPESGIAAIEGLAAIHLRDAATAPPANLIPYTEAKNHIGETVTIEAKVFEKVDAGSMWVLFLGGPSSDPNAVGIEVQKSDVALFPADLYVGKTIRITGELHSNPVGGASFSLTDPAQVVVLD